MMVGAATVDAVRRIAERANDVLAAFAPAGPLPSSDPLAVAAPPGASFITQDAAGKRAYSRAGAFHVDDGGALRGVDGGAVLGFTGTGAAALLGPVRLPEPDRTLGRCDDLRIESDGTLAYTRTAIDPRTRERSVERAVVAQLALARFPAGSVGAPDGIVPHIGRPSDGIFGPLATYAREARGVDIDAGLARLSEAYLTLRALHAVQRADAHGQKVALDLVK
jgi:hypothetical protein